jgi:NADH-quinone oxidoreductase subunit C
MSPSLEQLADEFSRLLAPAPGLPEGPPASGAAIEPSPGPAQLPPSPVRLLDYGATGCHLEAAVSPGQVVAAAALLDRHGFSLDTITGVDWIAQDEMEVIYDFFHPAAAMRVAVRTRLSRGNPELPTISGVFAGANWHERETHEFFGIRFLGHPGLSPLLLPEDADYHPLRKDFKA